MHIFFVSVLKYICVCLCACVCVCSPVVATALMQKRTALEMSLYAVISKASESSFWWVVLISPSATTSQQAHLWYQVVIPAARYCCFIYSAKVSSESRQISCVNRMQVTLGQKAMTGDDLLEQVVKKQRTSRQEKGIKVSLMFMPLDCDWVDWIDPKEMQGHVDYCTTVLSFRFWTMYENLQPPPWKKMCLDI